MKGLAVTRLVKYDFTGRTPLGHTAHKGNIGMLKILLDDGASTSERDVYSTTVFVGARIPTELPSSMRSTTVTLK